MGFYCNYLFISWGTQWRSWSRHCATIQKVVGLIPYSVTGIFIDIILPAGPWINSASNRIEYQEYFLGGKSGWCIGLTTLPPSSANCFEICVPQPPGALRACTWIALLYLFISIIVLAVFHFVERTKRAKWTPQEVSPIQGYKFLSETNDSKTVAFVFWYFLYSP